MKKILMSLFTIAIVGALVGGGVVAVFTDTGRVGGNTFSTGTVNIALNGHDNPSQAFSFSNMAPGDIVTGQINVTNIGTLRLRYAMTTAPVTGANPGLANQLQVSVAGYSGPLSGALIGNPVQGYQAGDRPLDVGGGEDLVFTVTLPLDADASWQGKTCTVTFLFHAEQTVNN